MFGRNYFVLLSSCLTETLLLKNLPLQLSDACFKCPYDWRLSRPFEILDWKLFIMYCFTVIIAMLKNFFLQMMKNPNRNPLTIISKHQVLKKNPDLSLTTTPTPRNLPQLVLWIFSGAVLSVEKTKQFPPNEKL